jgi:hypothetical protein
VQAKRLEDGLKRLTARQLAHELLVKHGTVAGKNYPGDGNDERVEVCDPMRPPERACSRSTGMSMSWPTS